MKDERLKAVKENCYSKSSPLTKKIVLALCKEGLCNLSYCDYFAKVIERAIKPQNIIRPKIVCLCGSTQFVEKFFEVGWDFTLKGYIVLSIGVVKTSQADGYGGHAVKQMGQDVTDKLDELHLRKIDMADEVFVINVGGYVGSSTSKEIEYAKKHNKPISYLESQGMQK